LFDAHSQFFQPGKNGNHSFRRMLERRRVTG